MMKAIAFNIPASGHVNPMLSLLAELTRRGWKVDAYLTEGYRSAVVQTGAVFHPLPGIGEDFFDEVTARFNPVLLATLLIETADTIFPWIQKEVARVKPDVVLYDGMCPWGRMAADRAGIPAVCLMSLMEPSLGLLWRSGELPAALRLIIRTASRLPRYERIRWGIRRRRQLRLPPFPEILNWPAGRNISFTSQTFQPVMKKIGPSYRFVGPALTGRPEEDKDFPWGRLAENRPVIYISLGTAFNDNLPFYRACLAAFKDRPLQVVMSIGQRLDQAALGEIPPNFVVRPFVPQLKLLPRVDLFISHAGMNSVQESLFHGVPLILVPQQLEQALVAARVAELDGGVVLRSMRPGPDQLWRAAAAALENRSMRLAAKQIGEELRSAGGAARAVEEIIAFLD